MGHRPWENSNTRSSVHVQVLGCQTPKLPVWIPAPEEDGDDLCAGGAGQKKSHQQDHLDWDAVSTLDTLPAIHDVALQTSTVDSLPSFDVADLECAQGAFEEFSAADFQDVFDEQDIVCPVRAVHPLPALGDRHGQEHHFFSHPVKKSKIIKPPRRFTWRLPLTRASDPMYVVDLFDGVWFHADLKMMGKIEGGILMWASSTPATELHISPNGRVSMTVDGTEYCGALIGDELHWRDGNTWIKGKKRGNVYRGDKRVTCCRCW